jgi:hypothetical protein
MDIPSFQSRKSEGVLLLKSNPGSVIMMAVATMASVNFRGHILTWWVADAKFSLKKFRIDPHSPLFSSRICFVPGFYNSKELNDVNHGKIPCILDSKIPHAARREVETLIADSDS